MKVTADIYTIMKAAQDNAATCKRIGTLSNSDYAFIMRLAGKIAQAGGYDLVAPR